MAGHSKWANIMYRKGAQDARRAKRFTKLIREVYVAAREGTPDPDHNPRLRTAVAAAKSQSVPKDNIERAIKKAAGGGDGQERFDTLSYEGFGPGGVAVIVDAITDNRNRTAATIRSIFSRHGGTLGETGSVNYLFQRVGVIRFPADAASGDDMFEAALEVGADECESEADGHEVLCAPEALSEASEALTERFGAPEQVEIAWRAQTTVPIDEDKAAAVFKLLEALDDSDDVQQVSANYDVSDDVLRRLSA